MNVIIVRGRRWPIALPAGMLVSFVVAFSFRWLTLSEFTNDHFIHVALAQQFLLGDWPVRDFVDPGLPLMYLVSAAVQYVVQAPLLSETLIFGVGFALAATLSFRLALLVSGSVLVSAGAVLLQIALNPRTYSYPKLLVYAVALTVGWWAAERLDTRRLVALAGVSALAYYFRHDHALWVGLGCLALLMVRAWPEGFAVTAHTVGTYLALCFLFVVPHLAYVQWSLGLTRYFAVGVEFSRQEARKDEFSLPWFTVDAAKGLWRPFEAPRFNIRWTPDVDEDSRLRLEQRYGLRAVRPPEGSTWTYEADDVSATTLQNLRADTHVEDTHNFEELSQTWLDAPFRWFRPGAGLLPVENSVTFLAWLWWLAPLVGVLILLRSSGAGPVGTPEGSARIAMVIALALCVDAGFLRYPLLARLPDVAAPHTILGAWIVAQAWSWPGSRGGRALRRGGVAVCTILLVFAVGAIAEPLERLGRTRLLDGAVVAQWRSVAAELRQDVNGPLVQGPARTLAPFFEYVQRCTTRDDRLLYVGDASEVYVFSRRGFAAGHVAFLGNFHSAQEEQLVAVERLRRQEVAFVIAPARARQQFEDTFDRIWDHLRERYVYLTSFPEDVDRIDVLIDASREIVGVDGPSGWPCFVQAGP